MKRRTLNLALAVLLVLIACKEQKKPIDVELRYETLIRPEGRGDNWCMTWCADGSQITSMDDGNWNEPGGENKYHNNIYRIVGEKDSFQREDIPGYPKFTVEGEGWFGYGVYSVEGTLYSLVARTPRERWGIPFVGLKILKSTDNGESWYSVNSKGEERLVEPYDEEAKEADGAEDMFFAKEYEQVVNGDTAYPFVFCSFVQCGQNNSAAKDDYVYVYSPEPQANEVSLVRVNKTEVSIRDKWEYFAGWDGENPTWTNNITERKPAHVFPEKNDSDEYFGWYSWLPSVVWNEGLGLYIMANGGTYAGDRFSTAPDDYYQSPMHFKTGSLGFWYSENPYGPWKQFYYSDYWIVDDEGNRTYQPKLSPKWISEDGTEMVLVWSDAMKNEEGRSHSVNYKWNQMDIKIILEP